MRWQYSTGPDRPYKTAQEAFVAMGRPDLCAEFEVAQKVADDPRVSPLGALLRRTSLDELPQLVNALLGDLSLVGPRPIVSQELDRYGEHGPTFLTAKPGITGLWQVSGRSDTTTTSGSASTSATSATGTFCWTCRSWSHRDRGRRQAGCRLSRLAGLGGSGPANLPGLQDPESAHGTRDMP
jgi:hypothetical protein